MTKGKTLENLLGIGTAVLAFDSIIVPFLTDGRPLHAHLGLPSAADYPIEVLGDRTALMAEKAAWALGNLYGLFAGNSRESRTIGYGSQ